MNSRHTERCLSDHSLDRMLVGDVALEGEARDHLQACGRCKSRMELFREDVARFAAEIPIEKEVRAVKGRVRMRAVRSAAITFGSLAALILIALIVIPPEPEPEVRTKGGLALEIIARHDQDGTVEQLLPGARLSPGDSIRFRIASDEGGYLAIVGMDSAQVISIYHPNVKIESGSRLLEGSIVLDATLGPEQIAAVVCAEVPEQHTIVRAGRAALDQAGGDPRRVEGLELGCKQAFFLIEKVAP